ncbi:hypothetical protein PS925_00842 [Pseudomonas fluorescens]|uniref:Integrase n=1 Tax=Pseudomonas fluorescens TaxID=294 RepID=A0A5E7SER0_PSEFL|nr:hypothetical protein [Pseudomonas fluorescens]VVP85026.1 hypothetical protein PS925_00842 [Pseudomonas fluorescens]
MAVPFRPFPIFPPYDRWHPNASEEFPENHSVRRRLEALGVDCLPFTSVWYCTSFLETAAHSWSSGQAESRYGLTSRVCEKMLNWSFLNGMCLLDWDHDNFSKFLIFLKQPPNAWCSESPHTRYMSTPITSYRDWELNDKWRPFYRFIDNAQVGIQGRRDMQRSAQIAREFFAFYISKTGIAKPNCAALVPADFINEAPLNRPSKIHNPSELNWAFTQVMKSPTQVLRSEQVLLYMAIARFTVIHVGQVRYLNQFFKGLNGNWMFHNGQLGAATIELSPEFSDYLERYFIYYGISLNGNIPAVPLFPTNDGMFGYSLDAIRRHMNDVAGMLAEKASKDDDPQIRLLEMSLKRISFASIRRSSEYDSIFRRRNSRRS